MLVLKQNVSFFVGERIMENYSDSGILECWSCAWVDKC